MHVPFSPAALATQASTYPSCLPAPSRRSVLFGAGAGALAATLLAGCSTRAIVNAILPEPPPYPDFADAGAVVAEANRISAALDQYIAEWMAGRAGPRIPDALLPRGMDPIDAPYRLVRPTEIRPQDQWIVRPAEYQLDRNRLRGLYPDPHCTYLVPASVVVPFGHRVVVEGEFPHARFFDLQMSPPLDPRFYYYAKQFGSPEVPIVDVDIDPAPGHTNPFRAGADRNAERRSYRVEFEMVAGHGPTVEPAYREPFHRAPGNRRRASAIQYQGPLGSNGRLPGAHGRGPWDDGTLWVRYYAPDRARGPLAGVPLPRITYLTPAGEPYFVLSENRLREERQINQTYRASTNGEAGRPAQSPDQGWNRELGIFNSGIIGLFQATGKTTAADKAQGRALVRGLTARGEDLPPPGDAMSSNSRVPYIAYLNRGLNLERGHVMAITGRMPRFPGTLAGQPRMAGGQVRYLSFTLYPDINILSPEGAGIPHNSIMDEEMRLNPQGFYTLLYARAPDRPRNADAPGVSFQDYGPQGASGIVIRWLTVHPEWRDARITPDSANIGYAESNWLSERYNPRIVGLNNQAGLLGEYQPLVHYMPREVFEQRGEALWRERQGVWVA